MELKSDNMIFSAFIGGYCSPSTWYVIEFKNNSYLFKYHHDDSGKWPNIQEMNTIIKTHQEYNDFIENLKNITKDWKNKYCNDILDGTQWNITYVKEGLEYFGSNKYPENFNDAVSLLNKMFK